MSASWFYRIAAVLLVLYAAGHTVGYTKVDPAWGVDAPLAALRATTFAAQGVPGRTYWGFFVGFGLFVSVMMLFAATVAWQLGGASADVLRALGLIRWSFAVAFVINTYFTWRYFFVAPMAFSVLIVIVLLAGAWLGGRSRTI